MNRVFPYALPLQKPLKLAGGVSLTERKGFLIHNPDTGGWGDAAPLPGFSPETYEDVKEALTQSDPDLSTFPSLRFAMECALSPFSAPKQDVSVNALWMADREPPGDLLGRLEKWSHPVVKVKPGIRPDVQALLKILDVRPELRFRVDGNRQWSLDQTLEFFSSIPASALEYMEEPLRTPEEYEKLWDRAPVPVALDESLLTTEGRELAEKTHVKAFVLKPTLLGNTRDRARWVDLARKRKVQIVWSSCFESGAGLWNLARLAEGFSVCGLDTGGIFGKDLVDPRPLSSRGKLRVPSSKVKIVI